MSYLKSSRGRTLWLKLQHVFSSLLASAHVIQMVSIGLDFFVVKEWHLSKWIHKNQTSGNLITLFLNCRMDSFKHQENIVKTSLFCILKPNLLFVPLPFIPLSEPRALSAGCLPGREGGGHLAKCQDLWIFYKGERGGGRLLGSNWVVRKKLKPRELQSLKGTSEHDEQWQCFKVQPYRAVSIFWSLNKDWWCISHLPLFIPM